MTRTKSGTIDIDPDGDGILGLSFQRCQDTKAALSEPDVKQEINSSNTAQHPPIESESPEFRYRVSSKHLILAPQYIKQTITKPPPEGSEQDSVDLGLSDCDPDALLIILNIIHGYNSKVPRSVSIELLLDLAAVVEHLQCHEVVEVFASIWIQRAKDEQGPLSDEASLVSIGWAFRDNARIRDDLENTQENARNELFSLLELGLNCLCDTNIQCCFSCDAMCLGLLVKHRTTQGIHNNDPETLSPSKMYDCIRQFHYTNCQSYSGKACRNIRWFNDMRIEAGKIYDTLQGLDLDDYLT
ncbi:hypothetical protein MW887_000118 [Aspergillus wentii]|nr:hypothetical protein MW887_000118 [Aspergillus wentii]